MYNIRDHWIPAYFHDIEMDGLLRITSRSESSNFFFQHFHQNGDTLVEFYSSFESGMDKQCHLNTENDTKSKHTPHTATTIKIEIDASKLYTRKLFHFVSEDIKSACYHTNIPDMSKDHHSRNYKVEDELMHGKIFEVDVNLSNNSVKCSCNFYFRRGYLYRHVFATLHQCGVKEIPRKYVKTRWSKDAVKRDSILGSQLPGFVSRIVWTMLVKTRIRLIKLLLTWIKLTQIFQNQKQVVQFKEVVI
ncbi:hypothetical protein POM88_039056 [Heracleum sosnowskyi]|uniref:Protein FAR1-RELATED SEQUENCE n=1 Tax=Heracleum sosnowskyi TaxID=360622 RepID=A0AAD8M626_9APIA|nr:hypothetical protein POM88_039056 [Heracleum sosnowskyi]